MKKQQEKLKKEKKIVKKEPKKKIATEPTFGSNSPKHDWDKHDPFEKKLTPTPAMNTDDFKPLPGSNEDISQNEVSVSRPKAKETM